MGLTFGRAPNVLPRPKNDNLYLNSQALSSKRVYLMVKGSAIRSHKIKTLYYSDVVGKFLQASSESRVVFTADNIDFRFKNIITPTWPSILRIRDRYKTCGGEYGPEIKDKFSSFHHYYYRISCVKAQSGKLLDPNALKSRRIGLRN